jgi:hypothetical protein
LGVRRGSPHSKWCGHGSPGQLARDSARGMRNFDADIVGASDSLTEDVMVMLIVVVVVVVVLMSVWVSGKERDIGKTWIFVS